MILVGTQCASAVWWFCETFSFLTSLARIVIFIPIHPFQTLYELQPYVEEWAGIELTPVIAYGLRLYRNNTSLVMHVDKPHTHVISFVLHIDSSEDAGEY